MNTDGDDVPKPPGAGDDSPRRSRGEQTAARLRDAARAVFAERGYAPARVEDIVAVAGVSHGTFYTYFDNKAGVLDALIELTASDLEAAVSEPWEGPDVVATIAAVIDRFVAIFGEHAAVIQPWLEASVLESHFRQRLREVRGSYVNRVAEQLRPVLAGSRHDPTTAAAALVAMVEGYATQQMAADDAQARADTVRTLTALWFGGLRGMQETAQAADAGRADSH
jgi:AcrR family transcriptional regulator